MDEYKVRSITRDEFARIEAERAALPISPWAVPFAQKVIDSGVMTEVGTGTIDRPQAALTRQEAAVSYDAILDKVNNALQNIQKQLDSLQQETGGLEEALARITAQK